MNLDSIITLIGTAVTLIGMTFTIIQANKAKSYKEQIKLDIKKINLTNVSNRLKRAQDEIRLLPTTGKAPRGVQIKEVIQKIQEHFDITLGALSKTGTDAEIRKLLVEGQEFLHSYKGSLSSGALNPKHAHDLQTIIQDALSSLGTAISQIEEKI